MHDIFTRLFHAISRHRWPYFLATLLFVAGCGFLAKKISFDEDISQIIPKNDKADITAKVLQQQNFSDKIVVIFDKKTSSDGFELSETAEYFLTRIKPLQNRYIKSIEGRVDESEMSQTFDFANANLPLLLNEDDYKTIEAKTHPDSIAHKVAENYDALISPTSMVTKDFILKDPLGLSFIGLKKLSVLNFGGDFKLENNFVVSKDGRSLLLFIEPKFGGSETKNNEQFVNALEQIRQNINQKFAGKTELSYFGSPIIAVANAKQIKSDIQKTVAVSMLLLFALLIFYFRNFLTPLIVFIPTAVSVVIALAFMYLIKHKISAISLSIGAILLGITIDYALHILTHYKHKANIEEVYKEISQPILMSASTTAVSFLCLVFVRSEALKDLGIFAAVTVMLSAVLSLIIIPHIYKPQNAGGQPKNTVVDRIGAYPYERNRYLVWFCLGIIVSSFFGFNKIKFNNNIGDLNFVPEEMKISEKKLEKLSDITSKSVYTISYGKTENEALENNAKVFQHLNHLQKQGKIKSFSSVGGIVLPENIQREKIENWNRFWTPERKQLVLNQLKSNGAKFGFNQMAFSGFETMLNKAYQPLKIEDYKAIKALQLPQFINSKNGLHTVTTMVKIDESQRDALISSVEENTGALAIDRQQMNENFLGLLKNDFNSLVNYSLIAVVIIFLIFFRSIDLTLFATIPIVLSGIVTAGILYFLGLELNIFSTIVCTLIFGAGVDFNIFLTQALQKELTTGKSELPTYRVSIILALVTTVLAIGALVFAKHPALYSVSVVALVGMLAVVIISFALYPLLFNFVMKRSQKGVAPVSVRVLLNSVFSLIYYALGGLIFSFLGSVFFKKAKGRSLERFKKIIAGYLTSVLYTNPFVKKRAILNPDEDFSKPTVIIANHTSFLDTLALAMVTHKIVYLVNDWVYNSVLFGPLVKALGFYPVSQGIENGIDLLQEKIDQGYSLVVFPEAERSMTNKVKRFHKGAFFLAEKYGLDVLPVYIHGNSEVMPKNDFMIHDGAITVKVGQRILKDDLSFGKNYSERTKKIQQYFRKEFAKTRTELEDENYFRNALFNSFLYKENEVLQAVKNDFDSNKTHYFNLNKIISPKEKILHLSGDFGQTDVLLALNQAERKITNYTSDPERRAIAKQNYVAKRRNLNYSDTLPDGKEFDILLVSDENWDGNTGDFKRIILFKINKSFRDERYSMVITQKEIRVFEKVN